MRKIRAANTELVDKVRRFDLNGPTFADLLVTGSAQLTVFGVAENGDQFQLKTDPHHLRLKGSIEGFAALVVQSSKPFALHGNLVSMQNGEIQDFEPVPLPPETASPLKQMRDRMRQEMGVRREAFDVLRSSNIRPGYEIDDNEPDHFEEDMERVLKAEAAKKEAAAASAPPVPPAPPPEPSKAPPEAPKS